MVSYIQQCHNETNVICLCAIIISTHITLFYAFYHAELWIIFNVKMSRCFYGKVYYLFSNSGKTPNVPEFEFGRFYKIILGRLCTCVIYIITARVSELTQLYFRYKFDSRKIFWIPYLAWKLDYSGQTELHYQSCLCFVSLKINCFT